MAHRSYPIIHFVANLLLFLAFFLLFAPSDIEDDRLCNSATEKNCRNKCFYNEECDPDDELCLKVGTSKKRRGLDVLLPMFL